MFDEVLEKVKIENREVIEATLVMCSEDIRKLIELAEITFEGGGRLFVFGNGGSASDALHLEAELVGNMSGLTAQFPAFSLVDRPSVITSISNDFGYEEVFSKQLEVLGSKGDMVIVITTSGTSQNCLKAIDVARSKGINIAVLTGEGGKNLKDKVDVCVVVPSSDTQRVQEAHIVIIHIFCEVLKRKANDRE